MQLIHVFQIHAGAAGVFQRPVVVPVENHAHLGRIIAAQHPGQVFEFFAESGYLPEDPGVFRACVLDHRTVELLAAAFGAPQLEELDGVRPVGQRLYALGPHLAGSLQGVIGLPVLLAGGLLHQHEGLALQGAHQVVAHGGQAPGRIVGGVVIPRNNIHLLRPAEVIQPLVGAHQVGGDGSGGVAFPDGVPLHGEVAQQTVGHEATVINGHTGKAGLVGWNTVTQRIGSHNIVPIVEGMAPEGRIPRSVQRIQCAVTLPQPDPESLFAVLTVTGSAVFVAYVPAHHVRIAAVALRQPVRQFVGIVLEDRAVGAGVVPSAEFMAAALVVHPGDLRVLAHQPRGHSTRGGGQHNLDIRLGEHIDDFIQLRKVVFFFRGLQLGPGEHVHRGAVDPGQIKQPQVFLPDFFGPLLRVVIAAVQHDVERMLHADSSLKFNGKTPMGSSF